MLIKRDDPAQTIGPIRNIINVSLVSKPNEKIIANIKDHFLELKDFVITNIHKLKVTKAVKVKSVSIFGIIPITNGENPVIKEAMADSWEGRNVFANL